MMWFCIVCIVLMLAAFGFHVWTVCARIREIESRVDAATFVPPCAHEWRKVAETVVPSVRSGGYEGYGMSAWEIGNLHREMIEAAQGATVLVLACDKCGERETETVRGAPR